MTEEKDIYGIAAEVADVFTYMYDRVLGTTRCKGAKNIPSRMRVAETLTTTALAINLRNEMANARRSSEAETEEKIKRVTRDIAELIGSLTDMAKKEMADDECCDDKSSEEHKCRECDTTEESCGNDVR